MTRLPNWRGLLVAWVAGAATRPFAEGSHDCALFAAGAIAAMTGADPAAGYRGRYRSTRGGLRVLRRAGLADHLALADRHFARIAPAFARAGDLAAVAEAGGPCLGIVQGERIYVLRPEGLATVPLTTAVTAWRVP